MGEIRIIGPGKTHGSFFGMQEKNMSVQVKHADILIRCARNKSFLLRMQNLFDQSSDVEHDFSESYSQNLGENLYQCTERTN